MVVEDIRFGDRQIPIQDIQELALDAADISLSKGTRYEGPMDVFECRIVGIFGSNHESAEEDSFASPVLGFDRQVGLRAVDVDECY